MVDYDQDHVSPEGEWFTKYAESLPNQSDSDKLPDDRVNLAWIRVIPEDEAEGFLKSDCYEKMMFLGTSVPNILKVLSLRPEMLRKKVDWEGEVLFKKTRMTQKQKEMLAVVTSTLVGCHY